MVKLIRSMLFLAHCKSQLFNSIFSLHNRFRLEWLVVVIGHATLFGLGLDPRLDVDGVM